MSAIRFLFLLFSIIYLVVVYRIMRSRFFIPEIEQKYNHVTSYIYMSDYQSEPVNLSSVFTPTSISQITEIPSMPPTVANECNPSVQSTPDTKPSPSVSSLPSISNSAITSTNETYMLVLFTSEVLLSTKVNNTLKMLAMFQREFSCRAIMFTTSEPIIRLCNAFGITTDHEFEENPYGIPYIGSLFMRAASLYQGHFYGYINADILLSTTLFTILPFILEQRVNFFPDRMIELCHNSFITNIPEFKENLSATSYERAIESLMNRSLGQRGASSVDVFILTPEFRNIPFENIVIARSYVDAYMIYWGIYKGVVIDMADQIVTIHQGTERYSNRAKKKEGEDYNWNKLVMKKRFGTLNYVRYMLDKKDGKLEITRKRLVRLAKKKTK